MSCSKNENLGKDQQGDKPIKPTVESFAPVRFSSGDKLYELIPVSFKKKAVYDFFDNYKIRCSPNEIPLSYTYERLTDSTSYFNYTVQVTTNLNTESYVRWWEYTGTLTWSSKTRCKGLFVCLFSSTKFPSAKTNETLLFEFEQNPDESSKPDSGEDQDDGNVSRDFILTQITNLERKKADAEKQLQVYLSWDSNATVIALIATQRQLITTYEQQIASWRAKL